MAILNLKIHFILPFCHFYFSFLAKFRQLEKKAGTSSGTFCTCAAHWQIKAV
jgi:hypothetical protein